MNSSQLRSSYQAYKLSVYNSPREYISVFAVRANVIAFCNFTVRTFLLLRILNPRVISEVIHILHLPAQSRLKACKQTTNSQQLFLQSYA